MTRWKNLSKRQQNTVRSVLRGVLQLLFFLFLPGAFTAAFNGVKYIFTQIGAGERIELTSFVMTLIALCTFTVIFGRFFCGFACAFGSLGDGLRALYVAICRRLKKKPLSVPERLRGVLCYLKYVILVLIILLCFLGAYAKTRGMSPWDVFSMLHARQFKTEGFGIGILLLVLVMVGMVLEERFFCRFLCPMGAVFSLLPILPFFTLSRERNECIPNCKACTTRCPSDIGLPAAGSYEVSGDCFQCQKCTGTCPKGNIHCGIRVLRGNEIWFTILRAAALTGIMLWLGL